MKEPIIEGGHNPCANCPTIPTQARMDKIICTGFGRAEVQKDGATVINGEREWENGEPPTFADAERLAANDPDHDWRVILHGPLHGETYQRQGPGVWLCVERNDGFA